MLGLCGICVNSGFCRFRRLFPVFGVLGLLLFLMLFLCISFLVFSLFVLCRFGHGRLVLGGFGFGRFVLRLFSHRLFFILRLLLCLCSRFLFFGRLLLFFCSLCLFLRFSGFSRFCLVFFGCFCGFIPNVVKVNLAQRFEQGTLLKQFFCFGHLALGLLVFALLGEYLFGFALHVFVTFELVHESVILLVADLGVHVGVIFYLAKTLFVFQEFDSCLKSYIQFC